MAKWITNAPAGHRCSVNDCKALIPEGSVCVEHSEYNETYACKSCGLKYGINPWGIPLEEQLKQMDPIHIKLISAKSTSPIPSDTVSIVTCNHVRNPWGISTMKGLNGLSSKIQELVKNCKRYAHISQGVKQTINSNIHRSTIAIIFHCTTGKHRSVAVAELVALELTALGFIVEIEHLDLYKKKAKKVKAAVETDELVGV